MACRPRRAKSFRGNLRAGVTRGGARMGCHMHVRPLVVAACCALHAAAAADANERHYHKGKLKP